MNNPPNAGAAGAPAGPVLLLNNAYTALLRRAGFSIVTVNAIITKMAHTLNLLVMIGFRNRSFRDAWNDVGDVPGTLTNAALLLFLQAICCWAEYILARSPANTVINPDLLAPTGNTHPDWIKWMERARHVTDTLHPDAVTPVITVWVSKAHFRIWYQNLCHELLRVFSRDTAVTLMYLLRDNVTPTADQLNPPAGATPYDSVEDDLLLTQNMFGPRHSENNRILARIVDNSLLDAHDARPLVQALLAQGNGRDAVLKLKEAFAPDNMRPVLLRQWETRLRALTLAEESNRNAENSLQQYILRNEECHNEIQFNGRVLTDVEKIAEFRSNISHRAFVNFNQTLVSTNLTNFDALKAQFAVVANDATHGTTSRAAARQVGANRQYPNNNNNNRRSPANRANARANGPPPARRGSARAPSRRLPTNLGILSNSKVKLLPPGQRYDDATYKKISDAGDLQELRQKREALSRRTNNTRRVHAVSTYDAIPYVDHNQGEQYINFEPINWQQTDRTYDLDFGYTGLERDSGSYLENGNTDYDQPNDDYGHYGPQPGDDLFQDPEPPAGEEPQAGDEFLAEYNGPDDGQFAPPERRQAASMRTGARLSDGPTNSQGERDYAVGFDRTTAFKHRWTPPGATLKDPPVHRAAAPPVAATHNEQDTRRVSNLVVRPTEASTVPASQFGRNAHSGPRYESNAPEWGSYSGPANVNTHSRKAIKALKRQNKAVPPILDQPLEPPPAPTVTTPPPVAPIADPMELDPPVAPTIADPPEDSPAAIAAAVRDRLLVTNTPAIAQESPSPRATVAVATVATTRPSRPVPTPAATCNRAPTPAATSARVPTKKRTAPQPPLDRSSLRRGKSKRMD